MGTKIIILFIIGAIAYGTNLLLKFILNKNKIDITYANTFIIEYIKFIRLIKNIDGPKKYNFILVMTISVIAYIFFFYYLYYIFISEIHF
jgi:hypothetical protein